MSDTHLIDLVRLAGTDSLTLLQQIVGHSAVPMGIVDPATNRFAMVNEAFCAYLGYSEAELTSMRWSDANHPDDVTPTTNWIARVQSGDISSYRIVKRYVRKDGRVVWGDLSIAALRRPDGTVWTFVGQVVDITEQVAQEQALRDSEERFRLLAQHSGDVVWRADPERNVVYVSPAIERTLGWKPDELIGASIVDLIHPDDRSSLPLAQLLQTGSSTVRVRFRGVDGQYTWCEAHTVAIRNDTEVQGFISTMRDITATIAAEKALADSERRYRLIAEHASDVVFSGTPDSIVEWVSPSIRTEFGLDPANVIGHSANELMHPADVPILRAVRGGVDEGQRITYRARVRAADERWHWVEVSAGPVQNDQGEVIARVGSMRKIDEQVRTEQALEAAKEQALTASLAKTAFLSRMSHELRTPLNAVLGFAQLLGMDALTPDQRESVEQIRIGGRHLLDLINEVLDISRIEAGRLTLSLEPVMLDEVVSEAIDLVSPQADELGITIQRPADTGFCAWADRQRTIQILVNLLSNAVKYNRDEGSVHVDVECNDDVRVSVTDTGRGLDEDSVARLFTPFERLGAERSGIEGTGVGLALSQGLAKAMNGVIEVTSQPEVGSTFSLVLPTSPHPGPTEPVTVTVAVGSNRLVRVLYIEDNPSNVRLMERICQVRDNTLLTVARTGREGLTHAVNRPPDLVLLDLHLPDIPGPDILSALRADPGTAKVPVVIVSADAGEAARQVCSELGADAFLSKPLDVTAVLHVINHPPRRTEGD